MLLEPLNSFSEEIKVKFSFGLLVPIPSMTASVCQVILNDKEGYITCFSYEDAEEMVEEADGYQFTKKGGEYFSPDARIPQQIAADYAVVLWAEALGYYDGVWWEETYDPSSLSAPRGVIFQGKIGDWKISRGLPSDDDHLDEDEDY
jgi:hypothetical protein